MRPASSQCREYVLAKVLEVTQTPEGDFDVRMAFLEPCPDELFEIVTKGFSLHELENSYIND
jgi:hypothetical protein